MRFPIVSAVFQKEMLDLVRDRRTLISMVVVPLLVIPLLLNMGTRVIARMQENAENEAKSMAVAIRVTTPAIREALEKAQIQMVEKDDLKDAVLKKTAAAAGVEEIAGTPHRGGDLRGQLQSDIERGGGAGAPQRLDDLKEEKVRESLKNSGIPASVLTPFVVNNIEHRGGSENVGDDMGQHAGLSSPAALMFAGGMYPVIDMTAGGKVNRKTIEALISLAWRRGLEIVVGKQSRGNGGDFHYRRADNGEHGLFAEGQQAGREIAGGAGDDADHSAGCSYADTDRADADTARDVRGRVDVRHRDFCAELQGRARAI